MNTLFSVSWNPSNNIIIMPCDFEFIGGSRGDEAMILSTIDYYQKIKPHSKIYIITFNGYGWDYVKSLDIENVQPLNLKGCAYNVYKTYKGIKKINPSDIAILGADCMDGYYSNYTSIYLLALHDIFSTISMCTCSLLGFSFNEHPDAEVVKSFKTISPKTILSIRDDISRQRFIKSTGHNAQLTADVAFLLNSENNFDGYRRLQAWIMGHRISYSKFIGFNLHPMLKKYLSTEDMKKDAILAAQNLVRYLQYNHAISIVLIPHDNRNRISDVLMLDYVYEYMLQKGFSDRVYYDSCVYHANQIKALTALLDGMITSRMHLAIACLGMGIPVMAISYQGKFEGLFEHFELPQSLIMNRQSFLSEDFLQKFDLFYKSLNSLSSQIKEYLLKVLIMSRDNF